MTFKVLARLGYLRCVVQLGTAELVVSDIRCSRSVDVIKKIVDEVVKMVVKW